LPRKRRIVVIKLGGSVITDKKRAFRANYRIMHRMARELARREEKLVLLNGAGSFGHIPVRRYGLDEGFSRRKTDGFSKTKLQLLRLQQILTSVLCSYGVPIVPLNPSSFMTARSGRLIKVNLTAICAFMDMGLVPLFGGDLVPDLDDGWRVVSADQMISWIAPRIGASMIIYGTDVDGLHTSDPKTCPNATLITRVACRDMRSVARSAFGSTSPDVTAGMRGKILEAERACKKGVEVIIMNLTRPKDLHLIIEGRQGKWTRILPARRS